MSVCLLLVLFTLTTHTQVSSGKSLKLLQEQWRIYTNECIQSFINTPPASGLVCNRTFDQYVCWPDGPAGTTVNVSCPWYLPWYRKVHQGLVYRVCGADGRWAHGKNTSECEQDDPGQRERTKSTQLTDKMQRHIMEEPPDMSIMLLGSTGSGKSSSGNTIIGIRETFKEDLSNEAVTRTCKSAQTELDGQTITVIDTVGLSDTSVNITDAQTQIEKMLTLHSVDVFLLVIRLGETFTENSKVVKWIQDHFGSKFLTHTIVLFTHGDQLHEPIERYLSKRKTLRSVVDQCSGGYHVFNNKDEDRSQVTELLKKIESLRIKNAYKRYTEQDYKQTQKDLLHKICAVGAVIVGAVIVAAVGALVAYEAVGREAPKAPEASMMEKLLVLLGLKAAAVAPEPGLAATVGKAVVIRAGGAILEVVAAAAAVAVGAGVYLLASNYSSRV